MKAAIPGAVVTWLEAQGCGTVVETQPVGGGCINNGLRLRTQRGDEYFLKTNAHVPAELFAREAEGLAALRAAGGPAVPRALLHGADFLLLEYLPQTGRRADYWESFGRALAALHQHTAGRFGFEHDNYLGSTPQPNGWLADGYAFFAERRLLFQARLAYQNGLLEADAVRQVERLAGRLNELIPRQPASLIHGDLWSGNAISDGQGGAAIIDPAAHYGWAEAELGMTALFGGFPEAFYRAYEAARPLEQGWRNRLELYNLYHLLNHLNLFGMGYWGQVMGVVARWS